VRILISDWSKVFMTRILALIGRDLGTFQDTMYRVNVMDVQYLPGLEVDEVESSFMNDFLSSNAFKSKTALQIVSVSGTWYALNSSLLLLHRTLAQRNGYSVVRAEIVSPDKIPPTLLILIQA